MKYFTIAELCKSYKAEVNHIDNTPNAEETAHLTELVDNLLDPFREYLGQPVRISSGFRCEKLNTLVSGSKTSAHRLGYAADIQVEGISYKTLQQILLQFCKERGIHYDQIFNETDGYSEWVHVGYKNMTYEQRMQCGSWIKA